MFDSEEFSKGGGQRGAVKIPRGHTSSISERQGGQTAWIFACRPWGCGGRDVNRADGCSNAAWGSWGGHSAGSSACTACIAGTYSNSTGAGRAACTLSCVRECRAMHMAQWCSVVWSPHYTTSAEGEKGTWGIGRSCEAAFRAFVQNIDVCMRARTLTRKNK
jgi:hypothetical protein